jgi:uncharacterized protein (UPF0218 family)
LNKITKYIIKNGICPNVSIEDMKIWAVEIVNELQDIKEKRNNVINNYLRLFIEYVELLDEYLPEWRYFAESEIESLKQKLIQ